MADYLIPDADEESQMLEPEDLSEIQKVPETKVAIWYKIFVIV